MSNSTISVRFEGGMKIAADIGEHTVHTDQGIKSGGENSAATPFEVFLTSIATCAGVYAKRFCDKKDISTDGLGITVECEYDPDPKKYRVAKMTTVITVPEGFPEKYKPVLLRNVEACTVKKQILEPPTFETRIAD